MSPLGIAVVGASGWGQNLVRAFYMVADARLKWVCDLRPELLAGIDSRFPGVHCTPSVECLLSDPEVHALVVAVDTPNHFELAKLALQAGKHVFVEKPLALSVVDGEELCALAEEGGLTLMVGHLLLYHPAVARAHALITEGQLGDVLYLSAQRVNLGIVRRGENAWWSLAPHDVAVALHLFGATPVTVSATGATFLQPGMGIEDVAFATLRFADGRLAHLHVSWLDPHKRRSLTVVGTRKMLTFDDTLTDEKLKVYDHGSPRRSGHATYAEGPVPRAGDVLSPILPNVEPLLAECQHFLACVARGERPLSDGRQGVEVVKVLEAGMRSLRAGGAPMQIGCR